MSNLKLKKEKFVDSDDWDDLVSKTYNRPYNLQQQDGCKSRGIEYFTVPSDYKEDDEDMSTSYLDCEEKGVQFDVWLARDPEYPLPNQKYQYELDFFWERDFYPNLNVVANKLYEAGLIEAGSYAINIDW